MNHEEWGIIYTMRPDTRKIIQLINYFALQSPFKEIGKLHILKYVYLADRYHLRKYGRLITDDTYYAMQYGPVASATKEIIEFKRKDAVEYAQHLLQPTDANMVRSIAPVEYKVFSETDREAIRAAQARSMRIHDPVAYTHRFPEWKKHVSRLTNKNSRVRMDVLDFFDKAPEDVEFCVVDPELLSLNKEFFSEHLALFG